MSFYVKFFGRSRAHALHLLDLHSASLPTPVLSFIKTSLENLQPPKDATRVILVEANGHLCDGSSSTQSSAQIKVEPIDIPD